MSVPLELTSDQLRDLSYALDVYAKVANDYGVFVCGRDPIVTIEGHDLRVKAEQEDGKWSYRLDDWYGS